MQEKLLRPSRLKLRRSVSSVQMSDAKSALENGIGTISGTKNFPIVRFLLVARAVNAHFARVTN